MFTIEEARAGHALISGEVARAEAALAGAMSGRERRKAREELDSARFRLQTSSTALETLARRLGVDPYAPEPDVAAVPEPRSSNEARSADTMSLGDVLHTLRVFGECRERQGDEFHESEYQPGTFLYITGDARTGIRAWGEESSWALSVFSAARIGLPPDIHLYRYVSQWRTTRGLGAPYVVETAGEAAIMCERLFQNSEFASDTTATRLIASTIDLVGEAAAAIARDLQNHPSGRPFTGQGEGGLAALLSWWEVHDERIAALR